jgi:hypothetical protein
MTTIDWGTKAEFEQALKADIEIAKAENRTEHLEVLTKALNDVRFSMLNEMKIELGGLVGSLNTSYGVKTSGSLEDTLNATHALIALRRGQLMAVEMLVERIEKKARETGIELPDLDR